VHKSIVLLLFSCLFLIQGTSPWGFFGHKRINRLAVFTLPTPLVGFYKNNIGFVTEHATDPDMRRYAVSAEAARHYIDLDRYGVAPFADLPRRWVDALGQFAELAMINSKNDTIVLLHPDQTHMAGENWQVYTKGMQKLTKQDTFTIPYKQWRDFVGNNLLPIYYEEDKVVSIDSLAAFFETLGIDLKNPKSAFFIDHFSEHGVLPYNLLISQKRLTEALKTKDIERILRYSADLGHYIGDAHVPLHTTQNYNGQLTGQTGIHAFWESRLPELFADEQYDYIVGQAEYVPDLEAFYWGMVFDSHELVDEVLGFEKELSQTFASQDQMFAFDERNGKAIRTYSREYSASYQDKLDGMVEKRMRAAILALGCAWFTAWTDAGQPELDFGNGAYQPTQTQKDEAAELEAKKEEGKGLGRDHE
jgi:hypothetical protein